MAPPPSLLVLVLTVAEFRSSSGSSKKPLGSLAANA